MCWCAVKKLLTHWWLLNAVTGRIASMPLTTTIVLRPFIWDYPGELVPEGTFTHSHLSWSPTSFISFFHVLWSIASSMFSLHGWQPLSNSSLVYLLVWNPPLCTPYFFTQSLSSLCNTCPYHHNLFCCSSDIMSSISNLWTLYLELCLLS